MKYLSLLIVFLCGIQCSWSQQKAKTDEGKEVLLYADGSWEYLEKPSPYQLNEKERSELMGKWKLLSMHLNGKLIQTTDWNYFLRFEEEQVRYNSSTNRCFTRNFEITNKQIELNTYACDLDPEKFKDLDYSGAYQIKMDTLSIQNAKGQYTFVKLND